MTREITTPIVLSHRNIIPGSEVVTVKGSTIPQLIRNSDYIMDYEVGELRFLADGAAIELGSLIEQGGLDIKYSYKVDFSDPAFFESQKEVFDEVATRIAPFTIRVKNTPVNDVGRIFNLTTQESYIALSAHNDEISFSGINAPRLRTIEAATSTLKQNVYSPSRNVFDTQWTLDYPRQFTASLNPVDSLGATRSKTKYVRLLITGGHDFLTSTLVTQTPLETADIQLVTGARTLRRSNIVLQATTDYSFQLEPTLGVVDHYKLTITLTASGQQKIRTNNLYLRLIFSETIQLLDSKSALFQTSEHPVNEVVDFTSDNKQPITFYFTQAQIGDISDDLVRPTIVVMNPDTNFTYQEGVDYTINHAQKTILKLTTGRIGTMALVVLRDQRELKSDFDLVSDVVLVDYVWGTNSINWSTQQKIVLRTEVQDLKANQQFIVLKEQPQDPNQVLIYHKDDFAKTPATRVLSYNSEAQRIQVDPITATGTYALEYNVVAQPIPDGTPYFVNYRYGADRRTLQERFAKLMNIESEVTRREEVQALKAGQSSTVITRSPTDVGSVLIFDEGDAQESPIVTAKSYDGITGTLSFTPIPSSGRKVIQYTTLGFDTVSLRKALVALFENFNEGPTLTGYQNIIAGFVDFPPEITSGSESRFVMPNKEHTIGNRIQDSAFQVSPALTDGRSSIGFQPARFNLGALFDSAKGSYIRMPVASNVSLPEGTIEFLVGVAFDPDNAELQYFFDVGSSEPRRNRISLYKSKQGTLNFDIWDNKGQLFRTSVDVKQIYFTEIINLKAGDSTAVLSHPATPAQIDLNDDQTPDFYEGLETRFIIMPETSTFPPTYKKASIKVLAYDPPTRTVTFEPARFSGRYVFSYITGLPTYEETENFIAVTWKLHTLDGEPPFYRLYINGVLVVNQILANIEDLIEISTDTRSRYDISKYDVDVYEGDE